MSDEQYDDADFTDDLGESIGYNEEFDWEKLDQAEVELHDRIIEMEIDELRSLQEDALTDLQLWALAQSFADLDDDAEFERIALQLIHGDRTHPAIDYGEIAVEIMNDWLTAGDFDQARDLLPLVQELTPDDPHVTPRFRAIMTSLEGDEDAGLEMFQELLDRADEDLELQMMVGLDMYSVGFLDEAQEVLESVRETAVSEGFHEMQDEIDGALAHIAETRKELEADA